jgi:hypothetical protein
MLFEARADSAGYPAIDVQRVYPGPGSIVVAGKVQKRSVVQEGREGHARAVKREPFGLASF